jgi:hypothetical protein
LEFVSKKGKGENSALARVERGLAHPTDPWPESPNPNPRFTHGTKSKREKRYLLSELKTHTQQQYEPVALALRWCKQCLQELDLLYIIGRAGQQVDDVTPLTKLQASKNETEGKE